MTLCRCSLDPPAEDMALIRLSVWDVLYAVACNIFTICIISGALEKSWNEDQKILEVGYYFDHLCLSTHYIHYS